MSSPQLGTPFDCTRQAILYEAGALTFAAPLLSFFTKETAAQSLALPVTISIVAMLWTSACWTCFDMLEARATNRSADHRPLSVRMPHAADLSLTAAYSMLALLFYFAHDRLYPIQSQNQRLSAFIEGR